MKKQPITTSKKTTQVKENKPPTRESKEASNAGEKTKKSSKEKESAVKSTESKPQKGEGANVGGKKQQTTKEPLVKGEKSKAKNQNTPTKAKKSWKEKISHIFSKCPIFKRFRKKGENQEKIEKKPSKTDLKGTKKEAKTDHETNAKIGKKKAPEAPSEASTSTAESAKSESIESKYRPEPQLYLSCEPDPFFDKPRQDNLSNLENVRNYTAVIYGLAHTIPIRDYVPSTIVKYRDIVENLDETTRHGRLNVIKFEQADQITEVDESTIRPAIKARVYPGGFPEDIQSEDEGEDMVKKAGDQKDKPVHFLDPELCTGPILPRVRHPFTQKTDVSDTDSD